MISIVEQELKDNLNDILKYILSKKDILENQILSEIPNDIKDSFIHIYSKYDNNKGVDIDVLDTFPQTPPNTAFILMQFEASEEDKDSSSLGNLESGSMNSGEGNIVQEKLLVDTNDGKATVTTSNNIDYVLSILQSSNFKIIGTNVIEIPYFPFYEDKNHYIDITYTPLISDESKEILSFGMNLIEKISIDFISPNTGVLKCLYAIMVYIQSYMKKILSNNGNVYLPEIALQGNDFIKELNDGNSSQGQQLFYRRMEVTYHTTQTFNYALGDKLEDFDVESGVK